MAELESTQSKPIGWEDVAIVVFKNGKPIIISSAEPHVLFDTFQDLVSDAKEPPLYFDTDERSVEIRKAIENFHWELHPIEQAKRIFCNHYANTEA